MPAGVVGVVPSCSIASEWAAVGIAATIGTSGELAPAFSVSLRTPSKEFALGRFLGDLVSGRVAASATSTFSTR